MTEKQLTITLIPGPDDPALESREYQEELLNLEALLEPWNPKIPATLKTMEAVAALPGDHSGEIIVLGKFVISLASLITGSSGLNKLANIVLEWKKANNGREVSLEIEGVKAKAQTVKQVEQLLGLAKKYTDGLKHDS